MNACEYWNEITEEDEENHPDPRKNIVIRSILDAPLPRVWNSDLRKEHRKEWAKQVRKLLKSLNIKGVSVTTPNYSMASTIQIRVEYGPEFSKDHQPVHEAGEIRERRNTTYRGSVHFCPYCSVRKDVHDKLEQIILAAFPDLDDRSDSISDYYNYCLSIHY